MWGYLGMVEYGNAVGQVAGGAGSGGQGGGSVGDVGATISSSLTGAINSASASLGIPPAALIAGLLFVLFLLLYFRFAR